MLKFFKQHPKTPIILQDENTECGHASLAMVLQHYGNNMTLSSLRTLFQTSLKGIALTDILKMAAHFNLPARALRLDMEELKNLQTPAILHWNMNHFVVLTKANHKKIIIHDPAQGKVKLSYKEASRHFTGIALELDPPTKPISPQKTTPSTYRTMINYIPNIKKGFTPVIILALLLQTLILIGPKYLQLCIDKVTPANNLSLLYWLTATFIIFKLSEIILFATRALLLINLELIISKNLGASVFNKLIHLPLDYFEKRHLGDILSRFSAVEKIRNIFTQGFIESIIDGLMAAVTLAMMLIYSIKISLIAVSILSAYCLLRFKLFPQYRLAQEELLRKQAEHNTHFMENIRGIQLIKIFNKEAQRQALWKNKYINLLNSNTKVSKQALFFITIKRGVLGFELIIIIMLGIIAITRKELSIGMLYAFVFYQELFINSLNQLIDKALDYKMLSLHFDRLFDIMSHPSEHNPPEQKREPIKFTDLIAKNISFSYAPSEPAIIQNLSLHISPGECIAITGKSGCGKTTLLKILMGLLIPTNGEIWIGHQNLTDIGHRYYRDHIAAVMQNDSLLSGTIAQNICFFDPNSDLKKIEKCCQLAGIFDDINNMPMKFNTLVGDMGSTLSGGQQQRLFLARALYAEPKILFLDEATSHLDITTEQNVNNAIKNMGITRIMIAHRPQTIAMADRVIELY